jgi:hypothetical protein
MAGKIGMRQRVTVIRAGPLAVRQALEDRGDAVLAGVYRQPDARGEVGAVTQRDQCVLDLAQRAGKLGDYQVLIRLGTKCGHSARIRARSRSHCAENHQPGRK